MDMSKIYKIKVINQDKIIRFIYVVFVEYNFLIFVKIFMFYFWIK